MKKSILNFSVSLATLALSIINLKKLNRMENNQERLEKLLEELNLATNDIAGDLERLSEQIKSGTVTRASLDKLDGTIQQLKELGSRNAEVSTTTTEAPLSTTTTELPVSTTTTQPPQDDVTTTTTTIPPSGDGSGNGV